MGFGRTSGGGGCRNARHDRTNRSANSDARVSRVIHQPRTKLIGVSEKSLTGSAGSGKPTARKSKVCLYRQLQFGLVFYGTRRRFAKAGGERYARGQRRWPARSHPITAHSRGGPATCSSNPGSLAGHTIAGPAARRNPNLRHFLTNAGRTVRDGLVFP